MTERDIAQMAKESEEEGAGMRRNSAVSDDSRHNQQHRERGRQCR